MVSRRRRASAPSLPASRWRSRGCGSRMRAAGPLMSQAVRKGSECLPPFLTFCVTVYEGARLVRRRSLLRGRQAGCFLFYFLYFRDFSGDRFRRRTPGPPPFSSMNSMPAASKARRTARSLATVIDVSLSISSARRIVATLSADCSARSSALQRIKARAALIWALVSGFELILTFKVSYAIKNSISEF